MNTEIQTQNAKVHPNKKNIYIHKVLKCTKTNENKNTKTKRESAQK